MHISKPSMSQSDQKHVPDRNPENSSQSISSTAKNSGADKVTDKFVEGVVPKPSLLNIFKAKKVGVDPESRTESPNALQPQKLVESLYAHVDREPGDNTESGVLSAVNSSLHKMVFGFNKSAGAADNGNNDAQEALKAKAGELAKPLIDDQTEKIAMAAAKQMGETMVQYGSLGLDEFQKYIEQGPDGVRVLAFCGGALSFVLCALTIINPLEILSNPVLYIYSIYQAAFAATTMLLECDPEWMTKLPILQEYQHQLEDQAKFTHRLYGRGFFFVFQGVLWLMTAGLFSFLALLAGVWLIAIGVMYVCMHYDVLPHECVQITRRGLVDVMHATQEQIQRAQSPPANEAKV